MDVEPLQNYIDQKTSEDLFSGSILVAKEEESIFEFTTGFANEAKQIPNKLTTKFNLGSATKMFTGLGIAQLAQNGMLSFADNVGKYLPEYPNEDVRDQITIHQLLTHTSGLGSFIDLNYRSELLAARPNLKTISSVVNLFKNRPLEDVIGKINYSSDGFELLGRIIEVASSQNYYDYIREHIYGPAAMTETDSYDVDPQSPRDDIAIGYTHRSALTDEIDHEDRHPNFDLNLFKGTASGAGYSTCPDLLKFSLALQHDKLLFAEMKKTVFTPYVLEGTKNNSSKSYGYGFQVWDIQGQRRIGHPGRFSGVSTRFDLFPDLGYTVIVLANFDPPIASDIADKVTELIVSSVK